MAVPARVGNVVIANRPLPVPLTKEQSEILEIARNTDKSIQAYLRENPIRYWEVFTMNPPAVLIATGAGGAAGFIVCKIVERLIPLPFSTAAKIVSTIAGAFKGGSLVMNDLKKELYLSPRYAQWKAAAMKDNVYPIFQKSLEDDERIREFMCPLSLDLIHCPVRAENDQTVFEKQQIEIYLDQCKERGINDNRTHPLLARRIRKKDLKFYPDYHKVLLDRINEILKDDLFNAAREGLIAYRDMITENNRIAFHQMYAVLMQKKDNGEITEEQFDQASDEIYRKSKGQH
ncbi:MAG: hypothetical protein PVI40_04090 [Chlamydiota bacterium]